MAAIYTYRRLIPEAKGFNVRFELSILFFRHGLIKDVTFLLQPAITRVQLRFFPFCWELAYGTREFGLNFFIGNSRSKSVLI
ncbi:hypothetical protein AWB61_12935 [Chromobacterium sp. F49]|nr:hypothetical protein Cv017_22195 [Chromobacterium subtsugae]KZE87241.1 hypothetical protein AWB61_12935 [Chromobacterium sp. F49]